MWITLLVMAVAVSLEPFRIGMTVLMLNRPGPALQLLAFLAGGFAMGTAVGLVVLFVLRHTLSDAAHFTLPKVQIVSACWLCWSQSWSSQHLSRRAAWRSCPPGHDTSRVGVRCG